MGSKLKPPPEGDDWFFVYAHGRSMPKIAHPDLATAEASAQHLRSIGARGPIFVLGVVAILPSDTLTLKRKPKPEVK